MSAERQPSRSTGRMERTFYTTKEGVKVVVEHLVMDEAEWPASAYSGDDSWNPIHRGGQVSATRLRE